SPDDPEDDWERAIDAHRRLASVYEQMADHTAQWTILLAKARLIDRHTFQTTPYRPSNRARAFLEPFAARLETIQPATEPERLTVEYLTRNVRRVLEREQP
ncbi:MAG: hypothetical protein JJU36_15715, partial [Phycisphaeraceae bacterium]|nr:hypothetical protein [Phycisphaeraceae bacterium]